MYDVSSKHLENGLYCSLRGRRVGDSNEHQGKTLTTPIGHHGTTLGVLRTHRWHSSTHTWTPRHVWCVPYGRNGMGLGTAYLLPTLAQGHLRYSSNKALILSVCLSVWGRLVVENFNFEPKSLNSSTQNRPMNLAYRSLTMSRGNPKCFTT